MCVSVLMTAGGSRSHDEIRDHVANHMKYTYHCQKPDLKLFNPKDEDTKIEEQMRSGGKEDRKGTHFQYTEVK
jgi:hypothetical protein